MSELKTQVPLTGLCLKTRWEDASSSTEAEERVLQNSWQVELRFGTQHELESCLRTGSSRNPDLVSYVLEQQSVLGEASAGRT